MSPFTKQPDLPPPPPIEGEMEQPEGKQDQAAANYSGPEKRCNSCKYFDGVDTCEKVDGDIDPQGTSDSYEAAGGEEETEPAEEPTFGDGE